MKVINVMTASLYNQESEFYKPAFITYFLSALKWKQFGFTTKIYVDEYYKNYFQNIGLLDLYDEVDDTYLSNEEVFTSNNIDKSCFWSLCKILIMSNEPDNFILADLDFFPLKDLHSVFDDEEAFYSFYRERIKGNPVYEDVYYAPSYQFPNWYTGKEKPINAAIMHIPANQDFKNLWLGAAIDYAKNNHTEEKNLSLDEDLPLTCSTCFAEQRLSAEAAKSLGLNHKTVKTNYELMFNERMIHLMHYKKYNDLNWILPLLEKLKETDENVYNMIINMVEFKNEKEYIENNGFQYTLPKMLERTNWWK